MEISKDDITRIADMAEADLLEENEPENKVKNLETRLNCAMSLLQQKQATIDQLQEALRKASFQTADKIPQSPPVIGNNDIFNLTVNKSYVILR